LWSNSAPHWDQTGNFIIGPARRPQSPLIYLNCPRAGRSICPIGCGHVRCEIGLSVTSEKIACSAAGLRAAGRGAENGGSSSGMPRVRGEERPIGGRIT
jgi:hypothetical protein